MKMIVKNSNHKAEEIDGLAVKSAGYSSGEPGFDFQHPQGRSQLSVTPGVTLTSFVV